MSTRRQLGGLALGAAAGLTLAASGAPMPAAAQDPLSLVARRTELTLPDLPALGVPYVCLLDLFDQAGTQVGTATAGAMIVGVTLDGPVVLATVVLHLADGEIHYQRVMDRFGAFPRAAAGAITGGAGAYRDATGEVDITWPDENQVDLAVSLAAPAAR